MGMGCESRGRGVGCWAAMVLGVCGSAFGFDDAVVRSARLSYLSGAVTVERADNTARETAVLNMPLLEGTRVLTASGGKAEIEFEDGSVLRLTPNSAVTLTSLRVDGSGNYLTRSDVLRGLVYAELRATPKYSYLLEAGGDGISPVTNATVRIEFDQPPPVIAVLDGSVHVASNLDQDVAGFQTELRAGESLSEDRKDASRFYRSQGVEKESWDSWNEDRDREAANASQARTRARDKFAGGDGYGWSDLDANGQWYDVEGTGEVWQPTVAASGAGFDPYGLGNWVWSPSAGYVFSSGYSWGWTPYRCGSWSYVQSFGWGWSPAAGCGGLGGGRFGGVRVPINIANVPLNYHRPHRPVVGPGGGHPGIPVHPGEVNGPVLGMLHDGSVAHGTSAAGVAGLGVRHDGSLGSGLRPVGTTTIGGQVAVPLRPIGGGYTVRGGDAVGSSLRRDFPVDATTGRPVMGVFSGSMPAGPSVMPGSLGWSRGGGPGRAPGVGRRPEGDGDGSGSVSGSVSGPVSGSLYGTVPGVVPGGAPGDVAGGERRGTVMRPPAHGGVWPTVPVRPAGSEHSVPARPGPAVGRPIQMSPIRVPTAPAAPMPVRPPAAGPPAAKR